MYDRQTIFYLKNNIMAKFIYIEGDANDGDYIGNFSKISDEHLELITPLLNAISCKEGCNYDTTPWRDTSPRIMYPQFSDKVFNTLENYIPYGENGIHSITSITVIEGEEIEF